jgi:hypothetical protein
MPLNMDKLNGSPKPKPKGFTPRKTDRPATVPTAAPATGELARVTQSEAMTVRESVNSTAGTGARALQVLTAQRDKTQQTIAAEIERLTDPDLFFAETMAIAAEKIRSRDQQREQAGFELDFFDSANITESLPPRRQLPPIQSQRQLSAAG